MDVARPAGRHWTADEFLVVDQHDFGDAWRYELVDGEVVALAPPSPEHAAILAGLTGAIVTRLRGRKDGCRPDRGAVPCRARCYRRGADETWSFAVAGDATGSIDLRSVGISLPLAEIYEFAILPERPGEA